MSSNEGKQRSLPVTLQSQLEFYFSDDNGKREGFLQRPADGQGEAFCEVRVLARFPRVLSLTEGKDVETAIIEAAQASPVLEFEQTQSERILRRRRPYRVADLGHGDAHKIHLLPGKDVADGKNFRDSATWTPAVHAPGHRTAEGKQGQYEMQDLKRKKEEKKERKRIQQEREEANRRKRQKDNPPEPQTASTNSDEAKERPKKEKKQKVEMSEDEQKKSQFRNVLNCCVREGRVSQALETVQKIKDAGFSLDPNQYIQLLHLCGSSESSEHWEGGKLIMEQMEEIQKEGRRVDFSESLASGMIKLFSCLKMHDRAVETWQRLKQADMTRKRRTYAPLLAVLAEFGRKDDALAVLEDAKSQEVDLLEEDYLCLARVCAESKDIETMYSVLRQMMELIYAIQPETQETLAGIFCGLGRRCQTVEIDMTSGLCQHCENKLESIDLENAELQAMCDQISKLAKVGEKQIQAFDNFTRWLARNETPNVIIDGANVGYYNLRPDQGDTVSYQQVNRIAQYFQSRGMRPVIIMHSRHFGHGVQMSQQDREVTQRWKEDKILYSTPPKMNDDWFWLYAGVWGTLKSGTMYMVSNDQMRDHHFQMLSQRKFLKWRERHWVNFHFDGKKGRSDPVLAFPSKISLRMQHVQGKDHLWHFPIVGSPKWLCCAME